MSEHPHSKTFPGTVRIVDRGPKLPNGSYEFPVSVTQLRDAKGKFLGTMVTVAAGGDLRYTQEHGKPGELPRHDVNVVQFEPAKPIDTDAEAAKAKAEAEHQKAVEEAKAKLAEAEASPVLAADEAAGEGFVYREDETPKKAR
jgi:hypothetical protein